MIIFEQADFQKLLKKIVVLIVKETEGTPRVPQTEGLHWIMFVM